MPFNLPNILTWMRILAIPLFVGIFYFPPTWLHPSDQNLIATIIFTSPDFRFRRLSRPGGG
jgi:cardiolipin synthase